MNPVANLRGLRAVGAPLLALALVVLAPTPASAMRYMAPAQAPRCSTNGLCMTATDSASLQGAYREGGREMQFEALYVPYTAPAGVPEPYPYPQWCVRLTQPTGDVYATMWGNPTCFSLWWPNYNQGQTDEELAQDLRRTREDGPIVFGALNAAAAAVPPAGRQEAWQQVVELMESFADTVDFHSAPR